MIKGLFVDLLHLPQEVCNDAIDGIYKALGDGGNDPESIWRPHESVLIRRLVELFTQRGLDRLESVHRAIVAWESGAMHKPGTEPITAPMVGGLVRWSPDETALVKLYLESLPKSSWSIDDHMLAVDLVTQTIFPPDVVKTESEWLATKAVLLGKVQASVERADDLTEDDADKLLMAMPSSAQEVDQRPEMRLDPVQRANIDFARVRAAENVQQLTDGTRHKMRVLIAANVEQKALGAVRPQGLGSLRTQLFDTFGTLNRDWRRIAVTEAGESLNQGFISSLPEGSKIKRVEQYRSACAFCKGIDNKVVTVVSPRDKYKDPDTMVWVGKNNIGRSAAPRKRVGDVLVPRESEEMWQIPAGLVHPHCRGRWVKEVVPPKGMDPDFAAFCAKVIAS